MSVLSVALTKNKIIKTKQKNNKKDKNFFSQQLLPFQIVDFFRKFKMLVNFLFLETKLGRLTGCASVCCVNHKANQHHCKKHQASQNVRKATSKRCVEHRLKNTLSRKLYLRIPAPLLVGKRHNALCY